MIERFKHLIASINKEGVSRNNEILKKIENGRDIICNEFENNLMNDKECGNVIRYLRQAMKIMSPFNISKLLANYNEYKNSCKNPKQKWM